MSRNRSEVVPKWARELTKSETSFVREYLVDLNATAAYLRIGMGNPGNRAAVSVGAHKLMHRPHVLRAIDKAMTIDGSGPRQWLIFKLRAIASANIGDFFNWTNNGLTLKPSDEIPRGLTALVSEIVQKPDGSVRLKLHDPLRALEILAKVGAIGLTRERLVLEDSEIRQTPDIELARRIVFLLEKAARNAATDYPRKTQQGNCISSG
jgi:phage terminase small subunit